MTIQNLNSTQLYQLNSLSSQTAKTNTPSLQGVAGQGNQGFGPAVEIELSEEALNFLQNGGGFELNLTPEQEKKLEELERQISKIFDAAGDKPLTREQLGELEKIEQQFASVLGLDADSFDLNAGLSPEDAKALDQLYKQIDKIFEQAGDRDLNEAQQQKLKELETAVERVLNTPRQQGPLKVG